MTQNPFFLGISDVKISTSVLCYQRIAVLSMCVAVQKAYNVLLLYDTLWAGLPKQILKTIKLFSIVDWENIIEKLI